MFAGIKDVNVLIQIPMQFHRSPPKCTEVSYNGLILQHKLDRLGTYFCDIRFSTDRFFGSVAQVEPIICLKL